MHETCLEYFKRRLSEGWRCIELNGYLAVLLSPEGSRHELDLRNDTVTLRPSGVGSSTVLTPSPAPNWGCCDEVAQDGFGTYVQNGNLASWKLDLYALPDPGLAGTINWVTIYCVIFAYTGVVSGQARGSYRTNGVTYYYGAITGGSAWLSRNTGALVNNTQSGSPWTWIEIDALEVGVSCLAGWDEKEGWEQAYGTQCYAIVDYTPAPPAVAGHSPWALDTRPGKRIKFHPTLKLG